MRRTEDILQMSEFFNQVHRAFGAHARHAGHIVGRVPHNGKIIRQERIFHAKFFLCGLRPFKAVLSAGRPNVNILI